MEMPVLATHKKPLQRQVHEAVLIQRSQSDIQINNKSEWSKIRLPRVQVNNRTREKEEGKEDKEKEAEERVRAAHNKPQAPWFRIPNFWT